ncbi:hypothetical protein [Paraflavitalea speifideaquila]|uniref:hypothetical protein n=1 Tax=Paraflavitalea speifideaquila TaxID=3076558 RepID=UPI0028E4AA82|nr:hypothetical protein [Paraflavitalea speifideiaquila]
MCYYNGVRVTRIEYIRLKQLEKLIANYDFLSNPLHVGFDYSNHPVLKRKKGRTILSWCKWNGGLSPLTRKPGNR